MRVLVTGSRGWTDEGAIHGRIAKLPEGTVIVHGGAQGADRTAGVAAAVLGLSVEVYRADWDRHGKSAGAIRNREMLDTNPDLVLAFWDGESRGTKHCIDEARRRGISVEVVSP